MADAQVQDRNVLAPESPELLPELPVPEVEASDPRIEAVWPKKSKVSFNVTESPLHCCRDASTQTDLFVKLTQEDADEISTQDKITCCYGMALVCEDFYSQFVKHEN